MKRTIKYFFLGLAICSCHCILFGQQQRTDSLRSALKTAKEDTNKVSVLNELAFALYGTNPDSTILLSNKAAKLAVKINFKKGEAAAYRTCGIGFHIKGDYEKALENYLRALKINEESGDKKGIAANHSNIGSFYYSQTDYQKALNYYCRALKMDEELGNNNQISGTLNNIGNVYSSQGNYPKALEYFLRALKISEKLENKFNYTACLGNIGSVYYHQSDYPKALEYFFRALKIAEELENKEIISINLGNIGNIYNAQNDYPKALSYYFRALKIAKEMENKNGIAEHLGNIGNVYYKHGNYSKALEYYLKALKIKEELGDKRGIAIDLGNISSLYTKTGKLAEAEKFLNKALAIDTVIAFLDHTKYTYEQLSRLYDTTGRYKLAFEHYKKYIITRDSINNEENAKKQTRMEMQYEFDKKEAFTKAEQEKKDAIAAEEKQRQKVITWSVSVGLFLVLLLVLFIYKNYRQKQKANVIITHQKNEVEKQKKIIEAKNKDITDSINYAKRIQQAKLPKKEEIYSLLPQSFILFKPKDIVSGDFYFFYNPSSFGNGNGVKLYIAACDCTGHGVPGACLSMVCSEKLEDAIAHSEDTSEILNFLNKGIKHSLHQSDNKESSRDGMDIALCSIDTENRIVKYSGANRPLWLFHKNPFSQNKGEASGIEFEEIKPTKKAIGGLTDDNHHFNTHEFQLQKGDTFYIFSDGIVDQFGGEKNKKYSSKRFREKLKEIQLYAMEEQVVLIEKEIEAWKGKEEQTDDILLIGIRM